MPLDRVRLERFTAFDELDLDLGSGINVFVGANGTGKTHLMKVLYAACDITQTKRRFEEKLVDVFLPSGRQLGRLVRRVNKSSTARLEVSGDGQTLGIEFSNHAMAWDKARVDATGYAEWTSSMRETVYIPVKEMLSHGPGFRSLYERRETHFEAVYADIINRAYLPKLSGPPDLHRKKVLQTLQKVIGGKVVVRNEEFFLTNRHGGLEFTLLSEGMRKLGLVWLLVQNGTLLKGSVLFWDEPETNLNPRLFRPLVDVLLQLHRLGVQIFLATHDYAILKEFELAAQNGDRLQFHALFRDQDGGRIRPESRPAPFQLDHSPISEAFQSLYDREIERALGKKP